MNRLLSPYTSIAKTAAACALALFSLFSGGCHTQSDLPKYVGTFYLESPTDSGIAFALPLSKLTYHRMADPFLDLSQVTSVEQGHVTVNLPDGTAQDKPCVFFFFNDDGRERLDIATGSNQQRRIFLFLNDQPYGVRFIDQPVQTGQLFMFMEVPDKDLPGFVADLQESVKRLQALKNK